MKLSAISVVNYYFRAFCDFCVRSVDKYLSDFCDFRVTTICKICEICMTFLYFFIRVIVSKMKKYFKEFGG